MRKIANHISIYAFALTIILASPSIFACMIPDLQYYINFKPQEASLGSKKAKEIAEWLIFWREREGIDHVIIFSDSIRDDKNFKFISEERIKNITSLIKPIIGEESKIKYGITFHDFSPGSAGSEIINEIQISIQPQCKRTGNCCGGNSR